MNIHLVATIPTKSHLLKFVEYIEHLQPGQPLDLKTNSTICLWLKLLVNNKTDTDIYKKVSATKLEPYNARLRFKVGARMEAYNEFFYSRQTIILFNRLLNTLFNDFLLFEIRKGVLNGIKEKEVIEDFMIRLRIDDEMDRDSLKKATYRLRKAKKIPTIHQQIREVVKSA